MLTKLEITAGTMRHIENVRLALEVLFGVRICFVEMVMRLSEAEMRGSVEIPTHIIPDKEKFGLGATTAITVDIKFGKLPSGGVWFSLNGQEYAAMIEISPLTARVFRLEKDVKTCIVGTSFVDRQEKPMPT